MALLPELNSVKSFIELVKPKAKVVKQNIPLNPSANMFVVRFQRDNRVTETLAHTRVDREYQVIYYGKDTADVLDTMDTLSRSFMDKDIMIPIENSMRYIRVNYFTFSQPVKTEDNVDAIVGVLSTTVREARTQEQYDKIMHVYTTIQGGI